MNDVNNTKDSRAKFSWRYDIDPVPGLPMINSIVPMLPSISWIKKAVSILVIIITNVRQYGDLTFSSELSKREARELESEAVSFKKELEEHDTADYDKIFSRYEKQVDRLFQFVLGLPEQTFLADGDSTKEWGLEKYDSMFQSIQRPFVANLLHDDRLFAYWRVAGNNPILLNRINSLPSNFPLTNQQYQAVMPGDDLAAALSENRIYIIDYKHVGKLAAPNGVHKPATGMGYSSAPIVLFSVSKDTKQLVTVGIQCGQSPSEYSIFFPAPESSANYWGWQMAKTVVQTADENHHEIYTHLAYTHFVSEVFSVSTVRNFTEQHPLYKLLITHYEGTCFINFGATKALMQPGQFIDNMFAAKLDDINREAISYRLDYDIRENMLPTYLSRRGLDDLQALPDYPYRDDGLLIWNAISEWVSGYIDYYYWTDASIELDPQISNWSNDILSNAKLKGFEPVRTRQSLKDIITMAIFVASAQHAAVNFTQPDWMRYAPSMSASHGVAPPRMQAGHTNVQWVGMLPKYNQALLKIVIYSLLGGIYHGQLGDYHKPGSTDEVIFTDASILTLHQKFKAKLTSIESIITERNKSRFVPYTYLMPSKIPASTNI